MVDQWHLQCNCGGHSDWRSPVLDAFMIAQGYSTFSQAHAALQDEYRHQQLTAGQATDTNVCISLLCEVLGGSTSLIVSHCSAFGNIHLEFRSTAVCHGNQLPSDC